MVCTRCGTYIEDGETVCYKCGFIFEENVQHDFNQQPAYNQGNFNQPQGGFNQQPDFNQPQNNNYGAPPPQYNFAPQGFENPGQSLAAQNVSFGEAIKLMFKKYATFQGRASKSEYWYVWLLSMIINAISFAAGRVGGGAGMVISGLISIFSLVTFIPSIAVAVRRLHDTGKAGSYYFVILIPIAGPIMFIIQMCKDSVPNDNQWGPAQVPANFGEFNNDNNYNNPNNYNNNF